MSKRKLKRHMIKTLGVETHSDRIKRQLKSKTKKDKECKE